MQQSNLPCSSGNVLQAAMNFSDRQKRMALARRELYWFEMGRVLWHRDQLLGELQEAAVKLDIESEGEVDMWLLQPTPISKQALFGFPVLFMRCSLLADPDMHRFKDLCQKGFLHRVLERSSGQSKPHPSAVA